MNSIIEAQIELEEQQWLLFKKELDDLRPVREAMFKRIFLFGECQIPKEYNHLNCLTFV